MVIAIVFDCYAQLIECDGLESVKNSEVIFKFNDWLYEESAEGYLCVKESLNICVLDISVVLRFFGENYPDSNARLFGNRIAVEEVDESLEVICL